MTVSNTSNPYVLDTFDEDFPDQYNTLHEQARLGRAHKECSLARIGRKLKTAPEYGDSLRDPTRLMRRTSRVEAMSVRMSALCTFSVTPLSWMRSRAW